MKKALLKILVLSALGLLVVACSSPEDKKAEEISGSKVSELKKIVDIERKLKELQNIEPQNLSDVEKAVKQGEELEEEAQKYSVQRDGVKKILATDPQLYKKLFGEDTMYKEGLQYFNDNKAMREFVDMRNANATMQKLVEDTKNIISSIDKSKFIPEEKEYVLSIRKQYYSKTQAIANLDKELLEAFKKSFGEMSQKQDYNLSRVTDSINYYELGLPFLRDKHGFPSVIF